MPLWASRRTKRPLFQMEWVSSDAVQDGCWELGTPSWDQRELHRAKHTILSPSQPNICRSLATGRHASLTPAARRQCCSPRLQRAHGAIATASAHDHGLLKSSQRRNQGAKAENLSKRVGQCLIFIAGQDDKCAQHPPCNLRSRKIA